MVPKLILLFTIAGWSAQPYLISFGLNYAKLGNSNFRAICSCRDTKELEEGSFPPGLNFCIANGLKVAAEDT